MGKFIEEFYYGNLDPQARSTKQNKAVQKKMEVLMLNEDYLTENLSGESKKKFLEFVNAWGVVNGESNLDSFITISLCVLLTGALLNRYYSLSLMCNTSLTNLQNYLT